MTPKDKAKELYRVFYIAIPSDEMGLCDDAAKQCALIAVDEIIKELEYGVGKSATEYWQEVKQQIENL